MFLARYILVNVVVVVTVFSATSNEPHWNKLGNSNNYYWIANKTDVDWTIDPPEPIRVVIPTETQRVTLDIHRTALIVVDFQNDFCKEGGWLEVNGLNITGMREAIAPTKKLIPVMRAAGFKIIWLNWVNRKDYANMFPNQVWHGSHSGEGRGYGSITSWKTMSRALDQGSWGARVVDELQSQIKPEDPIVEKTINSGFWNTDLNAILRNWDMKNLIFVGVSTDQCIQFTMADALFNGYGGILVKDCTGTPSPEFVKEAAFWQVQATMGFLTNSSSIIKALSNMPKITKKKK